jgi:hypothetical protein
MEVFPHAGSHFFVPGNAFDRFFYSSFPLDCCLLSLTVRSPTSRRSLTSRLPCRRGSLAPYAMRLFLSLMPTPASTLASSSTTPSWGDSTQCSTPHPTS